MNFDLSTFIAGVFICLIIGFVTSIAFPSLADALTIASAIVYAVSIYNNDKRA